MLAWVMRLCASTTGCVAWMSPLLNIATDSSKYSGDTDAQIDRDIAGAPFVGA